MSDTPVIQENSSVNSQRRVIINRCEIVYGNTPIGLRRKHLEKMAAEQNVDLPTVCRNLISLTNQDRFLFLKNYYEKLNIETNSFFTQFNTYETYLAKDLEQKSEQLIGANSEVFQSRRKKSKSSHTSRNNETINDIIISDGNDNFETNDDPGSIQNIHSSNRPSTSRISRFTDSRSNNKSRSDLLTRENIAVSTRNRNIHPQLTGNTEDTTFTMTRNDNYESVINSIFFDDSQSKLKKILKEKSSRNKSPSPKKYNTMMETLLFG